MKPIVPSGIIAVIRASTPETAIAIATGLAEGGVDGIEITFTVPSAAEVIAQLSSRLQVPIGAGTVRTLAEASAAVESGATFVVSPDLNRDVVAETQRLGAAAVPGALTPGEVGNCHDAGADCVKIFPIGAVGGASYIRALSGPFPSVSWVVSGGVKAADVAAYREAGCHAICMGSVLIDRQAAAAGDVRAIAAYARHVLATIS